MDTLLSLKIFAQIVESGSHAELLKRGGSYAKLLSQHYQ